MFKNIIRVLGGDPNKREIEKLEELVIQINDMEADLEALSSAHLAARTTEFRQRLADGETLDDLLPEAFATVREASKRTLGMRPYDVQLIGGMVLHQGRIAEMRTGEGKTLVATLPIYLNALIGKGVHLVTVNDYLARRDARWMAPIYQLLGMSVGVLQMAARTENARNAFLVDLEKTSPHEDQHQLNLVLRKDAYNADITYGTNNEFGFDYLRDNLAMSLAARVQRGHAYAIIDEVDNILIDEARTPLIISGPASEDTEWYVRMAQVVRQLRPEDYEMNEKDRNVLLTEAGEARVEELLDMPMRDPERPEDISPEQARMLGYLEQALRAQYLYKRNKDYLVQGGKVVIVDEFTGRLMPGRRWSEGLHQAVEAKEGVKVQPENITYATITLQNYFRMYAKLSGMTGTALTESEEFDKIYKLAVLPIPTNLEYQAEQAESGLTEITAKDEEGYPVTFYAREDDPQREAVYWKRKDYPDVVFRSEEGKLRALTEEVVRLHTLGRPILVGTTSVEHSDRLARRMDPEPIRRLLQTILLRRTWMARHNIEFMTRVEPELEVLNKPLPDLTPGDLRPLAKSLELSINLEDPENLAALAGFLELPASHHERLLAVLRGGIPRQVLNARVHDQEAQIILKAGEYGAVTIATNMAGRGVDIKLGGEISDEMGEVANRVLRRAGHDPYNLTDPDRQELLKQLDSEQYYIYEDMVKGFINSVDQMTQVRALGGLHVIGSERHEARRIDNQLRGRAARQGDPGSSRFYLSLQDDLMRLFGGAQVEGIWSRVMVDESQPIEMNMLGRLVEQSQGRVEGSNFDVRKHLLEYDDVLNTQRQRIYDQRDRVFTKPDLSEDVLDMLRIELEQRIPQSLKDADGPWRLLAYLEEIQPSFTFTGGGYPSYAYHILFEELRRQMGADASNEVLIDKLTRLASDAIETENEHTLLAFASAFERTGDSLQSQRDELSEVLDNYWDTIGEVDEEMGARRPVDVMNELGELLRTPLRLSSDQQRAMMEGDPDVRDIILQQAEASLAETAANRVSGIIRRRLGDQPALRAPESPPETWEALVDERMSLIESILANRKGALAGENGEIRRDLKAALDKQAAVQPNDPNLIQLFGLMTQGSKLSFDPRTHRRATQRYQRMQFIHAAARLLQDQPIEETTQDVLEHLRNALKVMELARGQMELARLTQAGSTLDQLDERTRQFLSESLGAETYQSIRSQTISEMPAQERETILRVLGRRLQNEAYRITLVRSISNQWIDYLTQMEALRVSIGLEAYGQRDPLVQYKSRATDLFKELLGNIRLDVIGNLFRVQGSPQAAAVAQPAGGAVPTQAGAGAPANQGQPRPSGKKKRRRH